MYQSPLIFVFEIDPQRLALSDFPLLSYQIISFLMSLLSALKTIFKSLSGVGIASYWYSYVVDSKSYVVLVLLIVLANSSSLAAFDPPKERNKTSTREEMTSLLQSILNIVSLPKNKAFFLLFFDRVTSAQWTKVRTLVLFSGMWSFFCWDDERQCKQMHDDLPGTVSWVSEQFCEYEKLRTSRRLRTQEGVWAIVQKCTNSKCIKHHVAVLANFIENLCFFHRHDFAGGGVCKLFVLKVATFVQVLKTKNSTGLSWNCCQKLIFDFVRGGRGTKNNARRALFLLYQIENGKRTPNKLKLTSKTNFKPHKKDRLRLNYRYECRLQIPAVHCNNYYS